MKFEYDSRKNCASQMKSTHNFFSAAHFAKPLPTVNCNLSPVTCIHTFSAKERDMETGYSYFGSRYYNSDLSIWLSVDPQASKYPSLSPYVYCANNPIKLVDPNGEEIDWVMDKNGRIYWDENAKNQQTTKQGELYLGKEGQRSIGSDVWNYHSDGTIDELKPVTISKKKRIC